MQSRPPVLAVIGAGPKGIALAAKAKALADLQLGTATIHIIESHSIAANWIGTAGYTDAIREWNARAREKYHHTVEPLDMIERDGRTIVTGKVSGEFPGSPVNLEHVFSLEGDKIAFLDIH